MEVTLQEYQLLSTEIARQDQISVHRHPHTNTQMPSVPFFFQYVLNDKISYPEETFMDWEFKISVMYDIAKVRQKLWALLMNATLCSSEML